ncbi:hypothetical protein HYS47_02805 [Candidatus Woesearchaeota archaeon]|nr:hypothetical protein [Candidatus Woesearchaeota archaeon]
MPSYLTQEDAFLKCKKEGKFIPREEISIERVKATLTIAEADVASADLIKKNLQQESNQWSSVYKLYYDALHELTESLLHLEKVKVENHQCLFAYLCEKHPELELSWDFFEKVRTKRNGIHYYGTLIPYNDWKGVELQFRLYVTTLQREIKKRISL